MKTTLAKSVLTCAIGTVALLVVVGSAHGLIDGETAIGVWLFDDAKKGDTAEDATGNGWHGELTNGIQWEDGKFGGALWFSGDQTYVDVGDEDAFEPHDSSVTITFWANPDNTEYARLWWKNNGTGPPFFGVYGRANKGNFRFGFGDGAQSAGVGLDGFREGEWNHVAAVRDRDAMTIVVYLNGERSDAIDDPTEDVQNQGTPLAIGGRPGCCEFFAGMIDDVGYFRSAFSDADVTRVMEKGLVKGALTAAVSPAGNLSVAWAALKALTER